MISFGIWFTYNLKMVRSQIVTKEQNETMACIILSRESFDFTSSFFQLISNRRIASWNFSFYFFLWLFWLIVLYGQFQFDRNLLLLSLLLVLLRKTIKIKMNTFCTTKMNGNDVLQLNRCDFLFLVDFIQIFVLFLKIEQSPISFGYFGLSRIHILDDWYTILTFSEQPRNK